MNQQAQYTYSKSNGFEVFSAQEFTTKLVRWSWVFWIICAIYQCAFFPDIINLMMVGSVGVAWAIVVKVFLPAIKSFPLSTFLTIGFTCTQLYLPLLFTTLEGKPLIYNLELPELIFFHSLAGVFVLALSHAIYRALFKMSYTRSFSVLGKAGFFTPPSDTQIWLMGVIGLGATYYVFFMAPDVGWEVTGSASDKFIQGLIPFAYAPFFIPFGKLYGKESTPSKQMIPMLLVYVAVLLALSIGRNSTGSFMFGFTAVGFAYFLGLLLGMFKTPVITVKTALIGIFCFWLFVGPLSDLRTAMILVRGDRSEMPAEELMALTIDTYFDKEALEAREMDDIAEENDSGWDERYLDNQFTARFANIKFNDASLVRAEVLDEYDPYMQEYCTDYLLGALPDPFLKALNIDVDKEFIFSNSIGDYLYILAGGSGVQKGFRTGHIAGTGMATFGWWYLFLLGVGIIPVFYLLDRFSRKVKNTDSANQPNAQHIQFSFCGMLALTSIFQFLPSESVIMIGVFLIRGWIQMALLYFFMFHTTRILSGGFFKRLKFTEQY